MAPDSASLNLQLRRFPHLSRAPIVEAVIDIKAASENPLSEGSAQSRLNGKLPGYEFKGSHNSVKHRVKFREEEKPEIEREASWRGLRFESADSKEIIQFNADGIVFSRLNPYVDWRHLETAALKVWEIYESLTEPRIIQRIGVRFINKVKLPRGDFKVTDYIHLPSPPYLEQMNAQFQGIAHQEVMFVLDYGCGVKVDRVVDLEDDGQLAIILDIDVFTTSPLPVSKSLIEEHLRRMQELKNKIFFGSITEKTILLYK